MATKQKTAEFATPTPDTDVAILRRPDGTPLIIEGIDQQIVGADRCRDIERSRDHWKQCAEELDAALKSRFT